MTKTRFIFFITFLFCIQHSWAFSASSNFISLSAGKNYLSFPKNTNIEWSDFCYDKKMGCARFQSKQARNPRFGFIKVVSDKIERKKFKNYCKEVFELSKSTDTNLKNFINSSEATLPHCSWSGLKDATHFFWKDGITLVVTTSDQHDVQKMISEAKLK
ncbi:MAG: hypothetical protein PHY93_05265 [Bacteriovorax sp.]|nr:hypothetical protein [Bacteriovorax sp.]